MITKQDLINAKKEKKLLVIKNYYKDSPSWEDIDYLYDVIKKDGFLDYNSFGTMVFENDPRILKYYMKAISDIASYHDGRFLFSMIIIHFINKNNNKMTDKSLTNLFSKFIVDNPEKIPKEITIRDDGVDGWPAESWNQAIHSDKEDRFFFQGSGQSLWKIFHDEEQLNYEIVLSEGDMTYIPKGVIHSVESLCPRHSASIAFSDDPEILNS